LCAALLRAYYLGIARNRTGKQEIVENSAAYAAAAKKMTVPQLRTAITTLLCTCAEDSALVAIFATELTSRTNA
jgi:hypothetical protein